MAQQLEWIAQKRKAYIEGMSAQRKKSLMTLGEGELDQAYFYHILETHYPNRYDPSLEAIAEGESRIRHYLKSLFNRIELYRDSPYPTRENMGAGQKSEYFILTSPVLKRERSREKVFRYHR